MKLWIFGSIQYYRPSWCSKRGLRFLWQKTTRGFSDDEIWALYLTMAIFILPRLKRLREMEFGHPGCYTEKQWWGMVDKMIWSFEAIIKDEKGELYPSNCSPGEYRAIDCKMQEGLKLFGKNFTGLWN